MRIGKIIFQLLLTTAFVFQGTDSSTLIWAINGGGWRAMVNCMGFANLFARAGLFTDSSSSFTSISSNSGSAWFATQFAYSDIFHKAVLAEDSQVLYDFVVKWMESYQESVDIVGNIFEEGINSFALQVLLMREFTFAEMSERSLEKVTTDYGDPNFISRLAGHHNRVPALSKTSLYFQTTLYPTSRVRGGLGFWTLWRDSLTYLGPSDSEHVYTPALSSHIAIKENRTFFYIAAEDRSLPLRTCVTEAPAFFSFLEWEKYGTYPSNPERDSALLPFDRIPRCRSTGVFREPFGGAPTTLQATLASAVGLGQLSSMVPSGFFQVLSVERNQIQSSGGFYGLNDLLLRARAFLQYKLADMLINFGFSTQWPEESTVHDSRLGDGGLSDGTTLALSIGQHHSIDKADKSETLKAIVLLNYDTGNNYTKFMSYFNTTFNKNIEPGGYIWAPSGRTVNGSPEFHPWRSNQIFEEYLDQGSMEAMLNPVPSVDMSTVRMTVTTIKNPVVHVQAGQKVDLLLLVMNSTIPVFSTDGVVLGELARGIATSGVLFDRVKDFVGGNIFG